MVAKTIHRCSYYLAALRPKVSLRLCRLTKVLLQAAWRGGALSMCHVIDYRFLGGREGPSLILLACSLLACSAPASAQKSQDPARTHKLQSRAVGRQSRTLTGGCSGAETGAAKQQALSHSPRFKQTAKAPRIQNSCRLQSLEKLILISVHHSTYTPSLPKLRSVRYCLRHVPSETSCITAFDGLCSMLAATTSYMKQAFPRSPKLSAQNLSLSICSRHTHMHIDMCVFICSYLMCIYVYVYAYLRLSIDAHPYIYPYTPMYIHNIHIYMDINPHSGM